MWDKLEAARKVWDKLEKTYEGTTRVNNSKIVALLNEYELLKMEESENIEIMFTGLSKIYVS